MKIALQLYTMREFTKTGDGLRNVLRQAADMGYQGAQFSAVGCMNGDNPEVSALEAKNMLDEFGLVCCCTHRPWERLRDNTLEEIAFHKALGCDLAGLGYPPQEFWDGGVEGFRRLGVQMNEVLSKLQPSGIGLGFHNHAKELEPDASGKSPFDALFETASPCLEFIMDSYWAVHGGADMMQMIERFAGRLRCVHAKDRRMVDGQWRDLPVGEGDFDWPAILEKLATAGTEWIIPEQDNVWKDTFDSIRSSVNYLRPLVSG